SSDTCFSSRAATFRPLRSARASTSPTRPRDTPSGLMSTDVCSVTAHTPTARATEPLTGQSALVHPPLHLVAQNQDEPPRQQEQHPDDQDRQVEETTDQHQDLQAEVEGECPGPALQPGAEDHQHREAHQVGTRQPGDPATEV